VYEERRNSNIYTTLHEDIKSEGAHADYESSHFLLDTIASPILAKHNMTYLSPTSAVEDEFGRVRTRMPQSIGKNNHNLVGQRAN